MTGTEQDWDGGVASWNIYQRRTGTGQARQAAPKTRSTQWKQAGKRSNLIQLLNNGKQDEGSWQGGAWQGANGQQRAELRVVKLRIRRE